MVGSQLNAVTLRNLIDFLITLPEKGLSEDEFIQQETQIESEINKIAIDPEWSNYVFNSDIFFDREGQLDIDAVVEKILSYRTINL